MAVKVAKIEIGVVVFPCERDGAVQLVRGGMPHDKLQILISFEYSFHFFGGTFRLSPSMRQDDEIMFLRQFESGRISFVAQRNVVIHGQEFETDIIFYFQHSVQSVGIFFWGS